MCLENHLDIASCFQKESGKQTVPFQSMDQLAVLLQILRERLCPLLSGDAAGSKKCDGIFATLLRPCWKGEPPAPPAGAPGVTYAYREMDVDGGQQLPRGPC